MTKCFPTRVFTGSGDQRSRHMPSKSKSKNQSPISQGTFGLPKNWPEDIQYLADQIYSPAVTLDQKAALSRATSENVVYAKIAKDLLRAPSVLVDIRSITDKDHPACSQRGLFASQQLPPDSFIYLYIGYVHTGSLSDTDLNSNYDLSYDREIGLSIDATNVGNEARFVNDYRGIAERPNAEFRDCFIQVRSDKRKDGVKWERRVGVFVLPAGNAGKRKAGIKAGEEILVTYGKGYWEGRKSSTP